MALVAGTVFSTALRKANELLMAMALHALSDAPGSVSPSTAASARSEAAMRARCWSRRPGLPRRRPDRCMRSSSAFGLGVATGSPPLFATRSPAQTKNSTPRDKRLVHLIR